MTSPVLGPPPLQVPIAAQGGGVTAAWTAWFDNLRAVASGLADSDFAKAPDASSAIANVVAALAAAVQELQTQPRQELGTFAALQQANLPWTTFDTTPEAVPTDVPGTVYWSDDDSTLDLALLGGVSYQFGQQLDFYSKNTSGVQINKGMAVMATGVVGASTKITCARAVANGTVAAQYMLGIATQDIAPNAFGYVAWFGSIRGFNTTGANKTVPEVWVDGDILYFDPTYPGELTKTRPAAPALDLPIAIITNAANNGAIFVRMKTGESMDELHDVQAPSPSSGNLLIYDAPQARWEANSLTAGNGIVVTNAAGAITLTNNIAAGANISITGTNPLTIAASFTTTGSTGSVTLAEVSPGGTQGSLTFANGLITAFVAPT